MRKSLQIILILAVMCTSLLSSFAQTGGITISGKISDSKGLGIPGVGIRIKGAAKGGTTSSVGGQYTIKLNMPTDVLIFSSVGYASQEITMVAKKNIVNVVLREQQNALDEVVVIGYGEVRKGDLTGSVGSVNMADFQKAPVRSFEEALAGRVAGVQVTSPEGQPGAGSDIVIRGNSSVTQDNSPLYVIDGFPMETPNNNVINPSDIESIDILKDASATAIYGARGANGVIIITTKKGKMGKPVVSYDGYYGFQEVIKRAKMMDPYEFVRYQLEIDAAGAPLSYLSNGRTLEDYRQLKGIDWQEQMFKTAKMQSHNFAVRGGTDLTKYAISGSGLGQDGIIINSGFNRSQARVSLDQTVNNKFKLGMNANYSSTKVTGVTPSTYNGTSNSLSLLYSVWGYRPITGGTVPLGDLIDLPLDPDVDGTGDYRYNPIVSARNEINNSFENTLVGNGYAEYKILPQLTLRVTGGLTRQSRRTEVFYNSQTKYGDINSAQGARGASGRLYSFERNNYLNENTLNYKKVFNKVHSFSALAGFTMQKENIINFGYQATGLPNEVLGLSGLDEGTPLNTAALFTDNFLVSYLSRFNYSYKSRYILTASMRADGSSKFSKGNKWGYFPSGAFAWRLSDEKFFKQSIKFVSSAKLRTSIGVTGNNRISDFGALPTITFPISRYYTFENAYYPGAIPTTLGNKDLKWESTLQMDAGIDLSFLKGRLNLTVDYYNKKTYDLLLNALIPSSSGFESALINVGKVRNSGWEFELTTDNVMKKGFKWSTSFNIAFNKNKVLELARNQESVTQSIGWETGYNNIPPYIAKLNQPIGQFFGLKWLGNYQYIDFDRQPNGKYVLKNTVADNGSGRDKVQPGDIKYEDINGDGTVNALDRMVIGSPNPDFTGGMSNNFTYKSLDLNVFLQWSYGNDVLNANRLVFEGSPRLSLNQFDSYADRWTDQNQNNTNFRSLGYGPTAYSSRIIEDASYLRLKTISLGYNFSGKPLQAIGLKSLRIYSSAQNLWTWTNYSGLDPEVSTKNSALTRGFDFAAYPRAKTIVFGLTASL